MKVIKLEVIEKTSKKGNNYKGLYAITENGQEIFICFVKQFINFMINKNNYEKGGKVIWEKHL